MISQGNPDDAPLRDDISEDDEDFALEESSGVDLTPGLDAPESVKREYLVSSNHRSSSWKGQAVYQSLLVNGDLHPEAVWSYPEPSEAAASIKGRLAFGKGVKIA